LTVVADQFGSPTLTRDLAGVIRDMVRTDERGILRVTNTGFCSCFEFALEVLRQDGAQFACCQLPRLKQGAQPGVPPIRSFHRRASMSWHDVAELAEGQKATRAYLEELRGRGKLF
jgi:dTDP-4-dehydrorhamnose reductase